VIRRDMWEDQVDDVIELYAAWVPHDDPSKYADDRKALMRLLAGRKNCRDFIQGTARDVLLPKSSLDGQRATVLDKELSGAIHRKLRVRRGEQLDVVGVVKRIGLGKDNELFPSVSRIAADVWIRGIEKRGGDSILKTFVDHCDSLRRDILHRLDSSLGQFQSFPFEGTALFRTRHHEWWEETEDAPARERRPEPPDWYAEFDRQLKLVEAFAAEKRIGKEPNPYLAVLVADGDRMGAAISELGSVRDNQKFSGKLSEFATMAQKIVNDRKGILVYAGGDDVLAFLPVDQCLECARKLHDDFGKQLKQYKAQGQSPTLSVGIAVGHFLENLEDLLEYGRAAEKAAKGVKGKDALAVHLHKRGGAPIKVCGPWNCELDKRLADFARMMNNQIIPSKLPYELRQMATLYEHWPSTLAADAIAKDLVRLIAKKQSRSEQTVQQAMEPYIKDMDADKLLDLAREMLVARQFAEGMKQAGEKSRSGEAAS